MRGQDQSKLLRLTAETRCRLDEVSDLPDLWRASVRRDETSVGTDGEGTLGPTMFPLYETQLGRSCWSARVRSNMSVTRTPCGLRSLRGLRAQVAGYLCVRPYIRP